MNRADILAKVRRNASLLERNPHLSPGRPVPQRSPGTAPDGPGPVEAPRAPGYVVSFASFRIQPQDPDNAVGKFHVDALRYAGIIPNDTRLDIRLVVAPDVRVRTRAEERTEITVTRL